MSLSATVKLAQKLVRIASVTPQDGGCQELLTQKLSAIGFECEHLHFYDVRNLWATRGHDKPLLIFAGHTDVVPTGPVDHWRYPPFSGEIRDGMLHGRGSADMKGSIACFVTACERFVQANPIYHGTIGLLITSDEEGVAQHGTRAVIDELAKRNTKIDMCIVGEPTSVSKLGDMIKVGRRGSLNGKLTIKGMQGHIAYPHLANNPIHIALPALADLTQKTWDQGNENFQSTRFQISNVQSGTGALNVIPGEIEIDFNFRYSPETTDQALINDVDTILKNHNLEYDIVYGFPAYPYETKQGPLLDAVIKAISTVTDCKTKISTTGGTSDGRFIAPTGTQVVEFGPVNATIHQINERVSITDLDLLSKCYENILYDIFKEPAD